MVNSLDTSIPNSNITTDTPIIKDNDYSSDIAHKSPEKSTLLENLEIDKSSHHEVSTEVTEVQQLVHHCNNYVRNEVFNTFYKDYMEFNYYMNDIIKTIMPDFELVTNLSDNNTSLQSKIDSLEKEIENLRSENRNLKDDAKTHLNVIENLPNSIIYTWKTLTLIKARQI